MKRFALGIVVLLLAAYAVSVGLRGLGVGLYWVERHSPSGIPYSCAYDSKQDYIDATYDEVHYHEQD